MHQRDIAASQREQRLQHEQLMGKHADTQQHVQRTADVQDQLRSSLQTLPGALAQAMAGQPLSLSPAAIQEITAGHQKTQDLIFSAQQGQQQNLLQITAGQERIASGQQQAIFSTQEALDRANQRAAEDAQERGRYHSTLHALATNMLGQQQPSEDKQREFVMEVLRHMANMFRQAIAGHAVVTQDGLSKMAELINMYPQMSVMNIDNRQMHNTMLQLAGAITPDAMRPAIGFVLDALNLPRTETTVAMVAHQLAARGSGVFAAAPSSGPALALTGGAAGLQRVANLP